MQVNPQGQARALYEGARDTLPLIIAAIPFGIVYGALGLSSGLDPAVAFAMSVFVFAGSSQFVAVSLLAAGAAAPVIVLTTLIVNLRHLLYAANLMPTVAALGQRRRALQAFLLTDETFAVVARRLRERGAGLQLHGYWLGSGLAMYLNWLLCTALGMVLGQRLPGLQALGLDVAMVVAFIGIVVPALITRALWGCAASAAVTALATHHWPHSTGLLAAALAGILTGLLLEPRRTA